jgi:AraC-like DNA-binding protein
MSKEDKIINNLLEIIPNEPTYTCKLCGWDEFDKLEEAILHIRSPLCEKQLLVDKYDVTDPSSLFGCYYSLSLDTLSQPAHFSDKYLHKNLIIITGKDLKEERKSKKQRIIYDFGNGVHSYAYVGEIVPFEILFRAISGEKIERGYPDFKFRGSIPATRIFEIPHDNFAIIQKFGFPNLKKSLGDLVSDPDKFLERGKIMSN